MKDQTSDENQMNEGKSQTRSLAGWSQVSVSSNR